MPTTDHLLRQVERRRQRMARVNKILTVIFPVMGVLLAVESARWVSAESSVSAAPLLPDLSVLEKAPAGMPQLPLSAELFPASVKSSQKTAAGPAQIAVKEVQWKLLGVAMTPTKKAYLEELESKQTVAVKEGDRMGDTVVKQIEERTVVLEREGKAYEIRL